MERYKLLRNISNARFVGVIILRYIFSPGNTPLNVCVRAFLLCFKTRRNTSNVCACVCVFSSYSTSNKSYCTVDPALRTPRAQTLQLKLTSERLFESLD